MLLEVRIVQTLGDVVLGKIFRAVGNVLFLDMSAGYLCVFTTIELHTSD